jgi:hypothetical protein
MLHFGIFMRKTWAYRMWDTQSSTIVFIVNHISQAELV